MTITYEDILNHKLEEIRQEFALKGAVDTCAVAKTPALENIPLLDAESRFAERYQNPKRKNEFLASRRLIRHFYPELPPVLKSESGAPTFPPSFYGSISHSGDSHGTTLVAFASSRTVPVGIDIQVIRPVSENIISAIAANDHESALSPLHLFSAKEAAFKALSAELSFIFYPKRLSLRSIKEGIYTVASLQSEPGQEQNQNQLQTTIVQTTLLVESSEWIVSLAFRS